MTLLFVERWYDPIEKIDWAIALFNGRRILYRITYFEKIMGKRSVWRICRKMT